MIRRNVNLLGSAALAMSLFLALSGVSPASAEGGQISLLGTRTTSYPKVYFRVAAADARGMPIGGLKAGDFVVRENGQEVTEMDVLPVRQSKTPLSIVMAVDSSGSMNEEDKAPRAREAANAFIGELRGIDQVEIAGFGSTVSVVTPFTSDRNALKAGLEKLAPAGETALYDALFTAVADASKAPGNRVVMALSDGDDTASRVGFEQVVDLAIRSSIPVYTIGLGQEAKDDVLRAMAERTSGQYFKAPTPNDLSSAFKQLSNQIQNEYEVVYISPLTEGVDAPIDVSVTLTAGNQQMASAFSYKAPPAASWGQNDPVEPGQLRRVPRQDLPRPGIPAEMELYYFGGAGLLAALGALMLIGGLGLLSTRSVREARLRMYVGGSRKAKNSRFFGLRVDALFQWLARQLYRGVNRLLPKTWLQGNRDMLVQAGITSEQSLEYLMAARAGLAIALSAATSLALYTAQIGQVMIVVVLACGGLGYLLPVMWVRSRIRKRQAGVLRAMPNALDLLSITVEAGLGFDQALMEVCSKWQNALTEELTTMLKELRLGSSRREALVALARRNPIDEMKSFTTAIIQSDELGSSIARTLATQAEQVRIRRRMRAQEIAQQAAVKMTIPLVLFMLPALFVVLMAPSIPMIMGAFGG